MGILLSLTLTTFYLIIQRKNISKSYVFWSLLLVFYLSVLLSEVVGFPSLPEFNRLISRGDSLYHPLLNLIPFSEGIDISSILNIIALIPLGVALKVMWHRFSHFIPTMMVGLLFSIMIEVGQLFTLFRQSDINDIIMNTLGVIVGWILARYLFKWTIQRGSGKNLDWLLYFIISIVSVFLLG